MMTKRKTKPPPKHWGVDGVPRVGGSISKHARRFTHGPQGRNGKVNVIDRGIFEGIPDDDYIELKAIFRAFGDGTE